MLEGHITKLQFEPGTPIRYSWRLQTGTIDMNAQIGKGLQIRFEQEITCTHCGKPSAKSYGRGYCYRCFTTLARCDLCIVSPSRCHYANGTCREPEWGEQFCFTPHLVYLARSSGLKVGLTRAGNENFRWTEQGARAGLVIARTESRKAAGELELLLAKSVPDKTDWRKLVTGQSDSVDLTAECARVRTRVGRAIEDIEGVHWVHETPQTLEFPVQRYLNRARRIRLIDDRVVTGKVLGIIGQFIMFDHGAFNVAEHTGMRVTVSLLENLQENQMELF